MPRPHPTTETCTYDPARDTIIATRDGEAGIAVVELPVADVRRVLAQAGYVANSPSLLVGDFGMGAA